MTFNLGSKTKGREKGDLKRVERDASKEPESRNDATKPTGSVLPRPGSINALLRLLKVHFSCFPYAMSMQDSHAISAMFEACPTGHIRHGLRGK